MYHFGTFEFDPTAGQLWRSGRRVRLEPQPARLLAVLLSRAGEVVPRDDLKREVWTEGTHVDFNRGLAFCLAQVRSALGDPADDPGSWIRAAAAWRSIHRAGGAGVDGIDTRWRHPQILRSRSAALLVGVLVIAVIFAAWTSMVERGSKKGGGRPIVAVAVFDNETGRRELDPLAAQGAGCHRGAAAGDRSGAGRCDRQQPRFAPAAERA